MIFTLIVLFLGFTMASFAQTDATAASLYNEGLTKLKAKLYAEALPLFEKAIAAADSTSEADVKVVKLAKSNGAVACYSYGNQLLKEKKNDEALKTYENGIAYNPTFYANYIGRAQALEAKNNVVEAVKAYLVAGKVSETSDKADKAAEMYKKAENFAAVAWGKKQWDNTIACSEAFLAEKETSDAYYYLSEGLKGKKQQEKALEAAKKAVELAQGEDKDKCNFGLAEVYEAMGQKDNAIATYKLITGIKYGERAKYEIKQLEGTK